MLPAPPLRKIIHIDMDMFYAAVEMRDRPELRGKPLVVGGRPDSRSVATTANYEARRFGIHSGMACAEARRRCPHCVFVPPDFRKYQQVSEQIRHILFEYTDLVETMSLDEAYLDVTRNKKNEPSATRLAREIKARILGATGLTASAGVAANMFVAKIASDARKPDGLCVVRPERVLDFIRPLPVIKVPGIGPVTDARLQRLGIRTVAEMETKPLKFLEKEFGKFGLYLYDIARGIDERPVTPWRERLSYGAEETFARDILEKEPLLEFLRQCARRVFSELHEEGKQGRTVTLKIKYADFQIVTRRRTFDHFLASVADVFQAARELLERTEAGRRPVRLAGIALSGFKAPAAESENGPPPLFKTVQEKNI
ncbi:MAG: DNA polymerase IV [Candidatus Aminicenantes bacterium]|nr:DNA polymerase IV [Candidatus Aminicenantes bacterium]